MKKQLKLNKNPQNSGNNAEKKVLKDEKGRYMKGTAKPENSGRQEGTRNFETEFEYFFDLWAKEKGLKPEEAKKLKFYARIKGLLQSDFSFHRDTDDRIYGKPQENLKIDNPAQVEAIKSLESIIKEIRK